MTHPPRWLRFLPLGVFLAVYGITCVVAAIPLAFDYDPLRVLVGYFAGVRLPEDFDPRLSGAFWVLLMVAPLLTAAAYTAVVRLFSVPHDAPQAAPAAGAKAPRIAFMAFGLSAGLALLSLFNAGAFTQVATWGDYGAWVLGRWGLYEELGYFEFVNLYIWLPLTAAWMVASVPTGRRGGLWRAALAVGLTVLITLLLFQKKALMVVLFLLLFALMLERLLSGQWSRLARRIVTAGFACLVVVYLTMTVLPVWKETTTRLDQAAGTADPELVELVSAAEMQSLLGERRAVHVAVYALLSPFTRTSLPAFYYADVFPRDHAFFGLDLGQDVLGFGSMPDDNRVVWDAMYPRMPGGAASAPFQFVLYSQVGLVGALAGSLVVGALFAAAWLRLLAWRRGGAIRPVLGAILLLLAIYLAIDSPRNSVLSSYGVLWAVVLAGVLYGMEWLLSRRPRPVPQAFT